MASASPARSDGHAPGQEHAEESHARIGPNAVIQVTAALVDRLGADRAEQLLHAATGRTLATLPTDMIDEREARALVEWLDETIGTSFTTNLLREAGHRTADYLLANRIPRAAQWVMRLLPRRVGLRLLLGAMQRNAWTFAGSGQFVIVERRDAWPELVMEHCPMCRGLHTSQAMCDFYAGTFERLIRALIARYASVLEVECMALGHTHCRFTLDGVG